MDQEANVQCCSVCHNLTLNWSFKQCLWRCSHIGCADPSLICVHRHKTKIRAPYWYTPLKPIPVQHGSDWLTPWVHDQRDIQLQVQTKATLFDRVFPLYSVPLCRFTLKTNFVILVLSTRQKIHGIHPWLLTWSLVHVLRFQFFQHPLVNGQEKRRLTLKSTWHCLQTWWTNQGYVVPF
jgi:hypothetical protein